MNNFLSDDILKRGSTIPEVMKELNSEIWISSDSLIKDIQYQFSMLYPYLKIEFCKKTGKTYTTSKIENASPQNRIKELTQLDTPQKVNINQTRTVAELASEFYKKIGLTVQLFRKSGNIWNIISLTEGWTLENQNKAGEFISTEMKSGSKTE